MSQGQHPLFCFPMASALTMTVFEVRTRVLPVQDPLSASGPDRAVASARRPSMSSTSGDRG